MKTLKRTRLAGVLFVVIALLAMMIPVTSMADPTTGTLIIHKYWMNNTAEATAPGTGNSTDESNVPADATPLQGITFKIYTVTVDSAAAGQTQGVYPDTSNGIKITQYNGDDPSEITDSNNQTYSVTLLTLPNSDTSVTTNADGIATASDIPQGIYLVVEQPQAQGATPSVTTMCAPFIVAVPMADQTTGEMMDTVNVYPKNEVLSVTKTADKTSVQAGDSVAYNITTNVPTDLTDVTSFAINDQLDSSLNYDSVSGLVANLPDGTTDTVPAADYTVDPAAAQTTGGALVTITLNSDGIDYLRANKAVSLSATLNVIVNKGIADNITATNTATASVTTTDDTGKTETLTSNPSDPVVVHTGTIQITKQDPADTNTPMPGAVFKVASSEVNAKNNDFLEYDTDGNIIDVNDPNYVTDPAQANYVTITTGSDSIGKVSGLADLDNSTDPATPASYWIVETTAPAGYNLLVSPVEVSFNDANEANNWTEAITVNDTKGFTLPLTGAAGVAVFTIVGVVLVGCAVILTVNMKKRKAQAAHVA